MGGLDTAQGYFDEILETFREFEEWCPGIVGNVLRFLVDIPQADELALYDLADAYSRAAQTLSDHLTDIEPLGATVIGNWLGDGAAAAFATRWFAHTRDVSTTVQRLNAVSSMVRESASAIETAKFMAATDLFMLAQAIYSLVMAAFLTFGGSLVIGGGAAVATCELAIRRTMAELLDRLGAAGARAELGGALRAGGELLDRGVEKVAERAGAQLAERVDGGLLERVARSAAGRSAGAEAAAAQTAAYGARAAEAYAADGFGAAMTEQIGGQLAARAARTAARDIYADAARTELTDVYQRLLTDALERGLNFAGFTVKLDGGIQAYQVIDGHRTGMDVLGIAEQAGAAMATGVLGSPFSLGSHGVAGEVAAMTSGTAIFDASNNIVHNRAWNDGMVDDLGHAAAYGAMGGARHDHGALVDRATSRTFAPDERPATEVRDDRRSVAAVIEPATGPGPAPAEVPPPTRGTGAPITAAAGDAVSAHERLDHPAPESIRVTVADVGPVADAYRQSTPAAPERVGPTRVPAADRTASARESRPGTELTAEESPTSAEPAVAESPSPDTSILDALDPSGHATAAYLADAHDVPADASRGPMLPDAGSSATPVSAVPDHGTAHRAGEHPHHPVDHEHSGGHEHPAHHDPGPSAQVDDRSPVVRLGHQSSPSDRAAVRSTYQWRAGRDWIEQNAGKEGDRFWGIRPEDLHALRTYTGGDYIAMNSVLRNGHIDDPGSWQEYVSCATSALSFLPPHQGDVYRGVYQLSASELARYVPGEIVVEAAFTSASVGIETAFHGNVEFVIESKSGREISDLSLHPGEREVLFAPNTQFRVVDIFRNPAEPGRVRILMREV